MATIFGTLTAIILAVSTFLALKNKDAYEQEISNRQSQQRDEAQNKKTLGDKNTALADLEADQTRLSTELGEKQQQQTELVALIAESTQQAQTKTSLRDANQAQLDDIREKTSRTGPIKELASRLNQIRQDLEELDQGISSQEGQLSNLTSTNRGVQQIIEGYRAEEGRVSRSESSPNLNARINAIYSNYGFVTLNAGNSDGVVAASNLNVMRGDTVIAKLLVTSVESNTASASIVPDSLAADTVLMVGDRVTAAPKSDAPPAPAATTPAPAASAPLATDEPEADPADEPEADPIDELEIEAGDPFAPADSN